jgi:flagellar hook assembly protein FlgD
MDSYHLHHNDYSPFRSSTAISFDLKYPEAVTFEIYTLSGRKVRSIFKNILASGRHMIKWDGRDESGRELPSGIYFYRLITDEFLQHKKMILVQ